MLKFILIISIIAYLVVGFLSYCEYKREFMFAKKWTWGKFVYLFVHGSLYVLIGLFIAVLGYLIYTM
ncbi:hypothetical protein DQT32_04790 [Salmonella enterica subsp. enterica serovar Braenderup]|nr:hypothetical protein [Salmonella enterica subsp. enterica serovar Braenderup]